MAIHQKKHNFPIVKLGEVAETINGLWKGTKGPLKTVGIIRVTNFTKNCEFTLEKTAFIEVEEKKYLKRKLQPGDLIVERSGGGPKQPVGRCVYFDVQEGEYSVSNFTSILRVKDPEKVDAKYLQKYLTALYFQGETERIQSNTTGLRNLDFDAYLDFEIPLPPLDEQREVVEGLERRMGKVEELEKRFEGMRVAAERAFKAQLNEAFNQLDAKKLGWEKSRRKFMRESLRRR